MTLNGTEKTCWEYRTGSGAVVVGHASTPLVENNSLHIKTWISGTFEAGDPSLPAGWGEIERLMDVHMDRRDSVFRRLAE